MVFEISEKISHCIIFTCAWTAWVFSVISLASYNWISENVGSINGPYTYGLFMERATCSLCQPIQNPPPFIYATRCFMIMGCISGFSVCALDVYTVLRNRSRILKYISVAVLIFANLCTLIGVSVFQGQGISLIEGNGIDGTLLQPYGYGLVLAWCCWVLYLLAVPLVVYEAWFRPASKTDDVDGSRVSPATARSAFPLNQPAELHETERPHNPLEGTQRATSDLSKVPGMTSSDSDEPSTTKKSSKRKSAHRSPTRQ